MHVACQSVAKVKTVALNVNMVPGIYFVPHTIFCSESVSFLAVHSLSRLKKEEDYKYRYYFDSVSAYIPYGHRGNGVERVGTTQLLLFSLEG